MPSPASTVAVGYSTGSARGAVHRTTSHPTTKAELKTTP